MSSSRSNGVSAALVVAAIAVVGLVANQAYADKPLKPEAGPSLHGTVKSIGTAEITLTVPRGDGTKATEEKTLGVAADVPVTLDEGLTKVKAPATGRLADLAPGTSVTATLAADKKSIVAIVARGPGVIGSVVGTDTDKGSLTLRTKGEKGAEEKTVTLVKDARIILTDGLTKAAKPTEARFGDLAAGTSVHVQLSVDRKRALGVRVLGVSLQGTVKEVDVGNNTITVTVKEDAQVVDKTLTLVKDARIEGAKLNELQAGRRVNVTLSVFDKARVAVVRVQPEG